MTDDSIHAGERAGTKGEGAKEQVEDQELLRRYADDRDQDAFAELVRRQLGLVYHAALRLCGGDVHRAEDVAQTVFTALARKAEELSRRPVLAGWLYTSTRYAAAQAVRGEARRQAREREAHAMNETLSDNAAGSAAEWERLRPAIDDALHALSERDRDAVLLRFFEGRGFADVGAKLLLSEDAARMRVERALEKMRTVLARHGVTSTSSALAAALANQAGAAAPAGLAASVTGGALAAADLTAASALGILQFMATTKFAVGAVAIVGFLALGTAGYKLHAQRQAQAALAAANLHHAVLTARLRSVEQRSRAAEQRAAELKQTVDAIRAKEAAEAEAARAAAAWDPVVEGKAFLQRHPDVARALREESYATTARSYVPFYRFLGLTPTQIKELQALVALDGNSNGQDVTIDGRKLELTVEEEAKIAPGEIVKWLRNAARDKFGSEWMKKYADFAGSYARALDTTTTVAGGLCFSETPLTPQQADQLAGIISQSSRLAGGKPAEIDWDGLDAKARSVLSAAQLPAWEPVVAYGRLEQKLDRAQGSSSNPTPAK